MLLRRRGGVVRIAVHAQRAAANPTSIGFLGFHVGDLPRERPLCHCVPGKARRDSVHVARAATSSIEFRWARRTARTRLPAACSRTGVAPSIDGSGDCHGRQDALGRQAGRDHDAPSSSATLSSDPGRHRPRREPQPARRQRHRHSLLHGRSCAQSASKLMQLSVMPNRPPNVRAHGQLRNPDSTHAADRSTRSQAAALGTQRLLPVDIRLAPTTSTAAFEQMPRPSVATVR